MIPAHALRNCIEEWHLQAFLVIPLSLLDINRDHILGVGSFKTVYKGSLSMTETVTQAIPVAVLAFLRPKSLAKPAPPIGQLLWHVQLQPV